MLSRSIKNRPHGSFAAPRVRSHLVGVICLVACFIIFVPSCSKPPQKKSAKPQVQTDSKPPSLAKAKIVKPHRPFDTDNEKIQNLQNKDTVVEQPIAQQEVVIKKQTVSNLRHRNRQKRRSTGHVNPSYQSPTTQSPESDLAQVENVDNQPEENTISADDTEAQGSNESSPSSAESAPNTQVENTETRGNSADVSSRLPGPDTEIEISNPESITDEPLPTNTNESEIVETTESSAGDPENNTIDKGYLSIADNPEDSLSDDENTITHDADNAEMPVSDSEQILISETESTDIGSGASSPPEDGIEVVDSQETTTSNRAENEDTASVASGAFQEPEQLSQINNESSNQTTDIARGNPSGIQNINQFDTITSYPPDVSAGANITLTASFFNVTNEVLQPQDYSLVARMVIITNRI